MEQYPQEFFIEIENQEYFLGRLTLNKNGVNYSVEIDIVQAESKKIYKHVDILYKLEEREDALYSAVQRLSTFFKTGK